MIRAPYTMFLWYVFTLKLNLELRNGPFQCHVKGYRDIIVKVDNYQISVGFQMKKKSTWDFETYNLNYVCDPSK